MGFDPTPEQQDALDAYRTGKDMVLEAGAGTGKTSTLKLMANATEGARGTYIAYNKAIATEAGRDFPRLVRAVTAHSLAFTPMKQMWGADHLRYRLFDSPRLPPMETSRILGAQHLNIGDGKRLTSFKVARHAMETVKHFCYSRDSQITRRHVPRMIGVDTAGERGLLIDAVLPLARKAWTDITRPDGRLRFEHDNYLKMWVMGGPKLEGDFLFLDEAQDANPLIAQLVDDQTHLQRIAVGDANQSIYGWRGATDFLSTMEAEFHLFLTQSFRFGPAVAEEANKWLSLLDAKLRIVGTPTIPTRLGHLDSPDAVLCRTNAEAVATLMRHTKAGQRAALVGGGNEFKRLALAAVELRATGKTNHPELQVFTSWGMVQDYVENDASGGDLAVAVTLIEEYGAETIIKAIDSSSPEASADVVISTAHKAKGREWNRVKVADDFRPPKPDPITDRVPLPSREDMMLAYVTVTRAQQVLDRSGLAWVDQFLPGGIHAGAPTRSALTDENIGRAAYLAGRQIGALPTPHELALDAS